MQLLWKFSQSKTLSICDLMKQQDDHGYNMVTITMVTIQNKTLIIRQLLPKI